MRQPRISYPLWHSWVVKATRFDDTRVLSSAVEHGIADPAATGSIPVVPLPFLSPRAGLKIRQTLVVNMITGITGLTEKSPGVFT